MSRVQRPRLHDVTGQATVELVALLPLVVACALGVWQAGAAGDAVWAASAAARAGARAAAVGDEGGALRSARSALPTSLRRDLRVRTGGDGWVRVTVAIPRVVGGGVLTTFTTTARFEPQR